MLINSTTLNLYLPKTAFKKPGKIVFATEWVKIIANT